ncbi:MAG: hypothetical protein JSW59_12715, partial [Phycisphaerales bacterium]
MNELDKYHYHEGEHELVNLEAQPDPGDVGSSNLLLGILRRWYIVLLVFVLVCGAGLPAVWICIKPAYNVTGAIRVKPDLPNFVTGDIEEAITNY